MQRNTLDNKSDMALKRFKRRVMERGEPGAAVLGLGPTGLGIIRSLGRNGIPLLGIDSDLGQPGAFTRYCEKVYCPDINGPALVDTLLAVATDLDVEPVLLMSTDLSVNFVSDNREELQKHYRFIMPEKDKVGLLLNKRIFGLYALENKLPIPPTFYASDEKGIRKVANDIHYPCIMKPVFRNHKWQESDSPKTFKVTSQQELIDTYKKISRLQNDVIVQEWIPGPDSEIFFCLLYFNDSSKLVAHFEGRKLIQWLPGCGSTAIAEDTECEVVLRESIRLFESIGFKGMGSVEFKRDPRDGQFKITEPTVGRANLQSGIASACGVDIPSIVYSDLSGVRPLKESSRKVRSSKWVHEQQILYLLRYRNEYGITIKNLIHLLKGKRSYAYLAWDDPKPFLNFLKTVIKKIITYHWFTKKT